MNAAGRSIRSGFTGFDRGIGGAETAERDNGRGQPLRFPRTRRRKWRHYARRLERTTRPQPTRVTEEGVHLLKRLSAQAERPGVAQGASRGRSPGRFPSRRRFGRSGSKRRNRALASREGIPRARERTRRGSLERPNTATRGYTGTSARRFSTDALAPLPQGRRPGGGPRVFSEASTKRRRRGRDEARPRLRQAAQAVHHHQIPRVVD